LPLTFTAYLTLPRQAVLRRTPTIQVQHPVKIREVDLMAQSLRLPGHSGRVHQDINRPKRLHLSLHCHPNRSGIRHIQRMTTDLRTKRRCRLSQPLRIHIDENQTHPVFRKSACQRKPKPARATGNQGNLFVPRFQK
jgi:hypothetical protein